MMYAEPVHHHWEQQAAIVRALGSLTEQDVQVVRDSVHAAGEHYLLERHVDYDGFLSILLTASDDVDRAFLVAGRSDRVELSAIAGDELRALGTYADVAAAMDALQPALDEWDWRVFDRSREE